MSLIHWWPLNGNLNDYGTKNSTITITNAPSTQYISGKIGQCYNFNGSAWGQVNGITTTKSYSLCAWAKSTTTGTMLFGMQCASSNYLNIYNSTYISLNIGDGNNNPFKDVSGTNLNGISDGVWHHWCVVFDGDEKAKLYIDGEYRGQATTYRNPTMTNQIFTIGTWPYDSHGYYWNGGINDVRIYDHALSIKEIKEISKCLVLHYTFEDAYAEGTTNLFAGRTDFSNTSHWPRNQINSIAPTVDSEGNMKLYGYATDGNHQSYTFSKNAGYTSISASTTYTLSVLVKYSSTSAYFSMYFYEQNSSGTATKTNSWRIGCTAQEVGHWVLRSKTITTQSTTTRMYAELNCYNCPSTDYIIMKNNTIQLEAKDHATPFVNGTRASGLVYDSSGYGRNATPINNPQILQDEGSGTHCVDLTDATKGYYDLGTATFNFITSGTVCFWAKYTDSSYKMILGANDSGSKYLAANTPNGSSSSGNWYGMVSTSNCYCDGELYSKPKIDSKWHFYCFTGVNFSTWGDLKYFLCIYGNNPSGSFQFHGYLADFKIYATNLSTSDILAEYNRKAAIDKIGNLFTGEFIEEDGNANITKNNIISSSAFVEGKNKVDILGGYTRLNYIGLSGTSSSGQFIRTGINSLTHPFMIKTIYNKTNTEVRDQTLVGQRQIGKYPNIYQNYYETTYGNTPASSAPNNALTTIEVVSGKGVFKDGTSILASNDTTNRSTSYELLIGAFSEDSYSSAKWFFSGYIYDVEIINNGELYRHFIPAKRNKDNVIGMFDAIEGKFYTNAGTGTFTAGDELGQLSVIQVNTIEEI